MRIVKFLIILVLLSIACLYGVFYYTIQYIIPQKEAESPLEQTSFIVYTPLMQRVLVKKENNQWCIASDNKCGELQEISETAFQIAWTDGTITEYEKIPDLGYAQKRHDIPTELLPERPDIKVQDKDGMVLSLHYTKEGVLENEALFGKVISQSYVFIPQEKRQVHHLYIELPTGVRQMYKMDETGVYHPIDFQEKQYRIFTFTPSFRRPIFLAGQIARLRGQTYKNFDMRVALKGFDKSATDLTFMKEWQDLIDSGRLILTFDSNEKFYQLKNVVDSMKNIDLSKYDYACKIDDDDWYAPEYLETMNRHLNLADNIASTRLTRYFRMTNQGDKAVFTNHTANVSGATFCLRTDVVKKLFDVVNLSDVELAERIHEPMWRIHELKGGGDDVIMHAIAGESGSTMVVETPVPLFLNGAQFSSVTRNKEGKIRKDK